MKLNKKIFSSKIFLFMIIPVMRLITGISIPQIINSNYSESSDEYRFNFVSMVTPLIINISKRLKEVV